MSVAYKLFTHETSIYYKIIPHTTYKYNIFGTGGYSGSRCERTPVHSICLEAIGSLEEPRRSGTHFLHGMDVSPSEMVCQKIVDAEGLPVDVVARGVWEDGRQGHLDQS